MRSLRLSLVSGALALVVTTAPLDAQDAPAVDPAVLLKELHRLRDTQTTQVKQQRQTALPQITAAAGSVDRGVAMWEEAVRAVQFDGVAKENAAFKDWKEKEGDGLLGAQARNAIRLYFTWLAITVQRNGGTPVKDLLPQLIAYTKDLTGDQLGMDVLEENLWREKDAAASGKRVVPRKGSDDQIKRMHDHILRRPLASSPVVQWLRLADLINVENWENNPSDFEGIYSKIILPELRVEHDPRVLEYWDMRMKKEADAASKTKLAFEIDKFNNQRRPTLVWSRAEDQLLIGQKNRALTDMLTLIRTYPQHPETPGWIAKVEEFLAPPPPPATAELPGSASSPSALPSATGVPGAAQSAPAVVK